MTEYLEIAGGTIAYDVTGSGPLVLLAHGMGDRRQAYRFLAPKLAQAGYRVASADLRGHGDSSMGWKSVTGKEAITRTDIAGDLIALVNGVSDEVRDLMLVGHNPGVHALADALSGTAEDTAHERMNRSGFPTSAMAVLSLTGDWKSVEHGSAHLVAYWTPHD